MLLSNYDREKTEVEQALAIAKEALQKVEKEMNVLRKRTDEYTGKIMPVENANFMGQRKSQISYYADNDYHTSSSYQNTALRARKHAEELKLKCDEAHQRNLEALENNKKLREKVEVFMEAIGMPKSYSVKEYKTKRSQGEYVKYSAGYLSDLSRYVPIDDGYEKAVKEHEDFLAAIAAYEKGEKQKAEKLEAERKKKEEQEVADKQLGVLVLKYELPYESGWKDILDHLLSKDKYLRLAHYLCENRNDWSDGYDKAEYGLSQFQAESEQDHEIVKDIQDCIDNWDGDGRVFRDTKWSYDEVFKLADQSLFKDYSICYNHIS